MIDDKAIMAAANKYNSDKGFHEEMERISFMDGVAWFKQALWHEADETPISDKNILTKFRDHGQLCYDIDNVCWLDDNEDCETHWVNNTIVAWCYIEDLLPNKNKQ